MHDTAFRPALGPGQPISPADAFSQLQHVLDGVNVSAAHKQSPLADHFRTIVQSIMQECSRAHIEVSLKACLLYLHVIKHR